MNNNQHDIIGVLLEDCIDFPVNNLSSDTIKTFERKILSPNEQNPDEMFLEWITRGICISADILTDECFSSNINKEIPIIVLASSAGIIETPKKLTENIHEININQFNSPEEIEKVRSSFYSKPLYIQVPLDNYDDTLMWIDEQENISPYVNLSELDFTNTEDVTNLSMFILECFQLSIPFHLGKLGENQESKALLTLLAMSIALAENLNVKELTNILLNEKVESFTVKNNILFYQDFKADLNDITDLRNLFGTFQSTHYNAFITTFRDWESESFIS